MKLLRESPVEFLDPLRTPPERIYVTEIDCGKDTVVMAGTGKALLRLRMNDPLPWFINGMESSWKCDIILDNGPFTGVIESLRSYFAGETVTPGGVVQPVRLSPFTIDVHRLIARIPFGGTLTYGDVAALIGHPGAARAVGTACGKNPVNLIVPCHRVVASQGLGGFGGRTGLVLKKRLLQLEKAL